MKSDRHIWKGVMFHNLGSFVRPFYKWQLLATAKTQKAQKSLKETKEECQGANITIKLFQYGALSVLKPIAN